MVLVLFDFVALDGVFVLYDFLDLTAIYQNHRNPHLNLE